jgi:hypothetical protein
MGTVPSTTALSPTGGVISCALCARYSNTPLYLHATKIHQNPHQYILCQEQNTFFVLPILWCSHTGDLSTRGELAKFGYTSERKVEKVKNPPRTYCLNMMIFRILFLKI